MSITADGSGVRLRLGAEEADLLATLPGLLETAANNPEDPAAARLRPAVYPDDLEENAAFWRAMADEQDRARAMDRTTFASTLESAVEGVVLTLQQAEAWLRVLGEARLVVAAHIGIGDESDYERVRGDPSALFLDYLGWLQGSLVAVLAADLPEG